MGTNTRQRSPLDWTPLSLHRAHGSLVLFLPSLPLTRAPHILAACSGTHTPAPLLNGTARGNQRVSRTRGRPKALTPAHHLHPLGRWKPRENLYRCLVQSRCGTSTGNKVGDRRGAVTAINRHHRRPTRGRTTDVSLLDHRGPDRCSTAPCAPAHSFTVVSSTVAVSCYEESAGCAWPRQSAECSET